MTMEPNPNEIHITRLYDAPVSVVWKAWTDAEQVAQWWGPRGFTLTTHSKELKPGGCWRYTMHGPDGVDYPNKTEYFEVDESRRLVYDHGATDDTPPLFRVTVEFTEVDGKTKMEMSMRLPTPEAAEETKQFVKKAGGNATWDRLAEYLEKQSSDKEIFVINRTFEAPLDTMFDLWTNPEHLSQWSGPTGVTMDMIQADVREGGSSFYSMTSGNNQAMYGRITYLEIRPPHRLVYTQQFCDANENISRHPLSPTFPETMLTTLNLAAEGPNQTRVTLTWEPYAPVTPQELETFRNEKAGMTQGWTGSFDKLEDYLPILQVKA